MGYRGHAETEQEVWESDPLFGRRWRWEGKGARVERDVGGEEGGGDWVFWGEDGGRGKGEGEREGEGQGEGSGGLV